MSGLALRENLMVKSITNLSKATKFPSSESSRIISKVWITYSSGFYDATLALSLAADTSYLYAKLFGAVGTDLLVSLARENKLVLAEYQQ